MKTRQIQIGDVTITYNDENKIHLEDGGLSLERFIDSNLSPEELAKATLSSVWDLYYKHSRKSDNRVDAFQKATGLSPVEVKRVSTRQAYARRSGEIYCETNNEGIVTFTIAPGCSQGARFPQIENRTYDVTKLFHSLVQFFK